MNDNKELIERLNWQREALGHNLGLHHPSREVIDDAIAALRAAPSTPPAPHAGTVGESERVKELEADLREREALDRPRDQRIAELEAEVARLENNVRAVEAERDGADRVIENLRAMPPALLDVHAICEQRDAFEAERDDLRAQLAEAKLESLSWKNAADGYVFSLNQLRSAAPPPPSPDAKLGEDSARLDWLEQHGSRVLGWAVSWENEKPWSGLRLRQTPHEWLATPRQAIDAAMSAAALTRPAAPSATREES